MTLRVDSTRDETELQNPARRELIKQGGLVVAFMWLGGASRVWGFAEGTRMAADHPQFAPNAFVRVGNDGSVQLNHAVHRDGAGCVYRTGHAACRRAGS